MHEPSSSETNSALQPPLSAIDYNSNSQAFLQVPDPFLYDPMIGDMLDEPFPDFRIPKEAISENQGPSTHPSPDPLALTRADETTRNEEALDPRLLLQNRPLDTLHTRALN